MRRRRQSLQVSTFPFLAVLLCAMGSLILLLLVIDRRAKVVARAKALEAVRRAAAEDEKAAASQAEWDRRRQALHEQLSQENRQVLAKIGSCRDQLETKARDLQVEQGRDRDLVEQFRAEQSRLHRQEEEMAARTQAVAQSNQQSEATRSELARLTSDLRKLEQTLADLTALRQRQQQTYSLVPYRGKRGDNRRPLYLECAASGLIFHPDRLTLPLGETSGPAVRAEVERRLARRLSAAATPISAREAEPYLLFLIRPNGIGTYYHTLAALNGLKLDFGYEFLEADWVLDFPEDGQSTTKQPWMVADEKATGGEKTGPDSEPAASSRRQLFRTVHGIPPRMGAPREQYTPDAGPEPLDLSGPGESTGPPIRKLRTLAGRRSDHEFIQPGSTALQGDPGIPLRDEEERQSGSHPIVGTTTDSFGRARRVDRPTLPSRPGEPGPPGSESANSGSVQTATGPPGLRAEEVKARSLAKSDLSEGPSGSGLNIHPLQAGPVSAPRGSSPGGTLQSEAANTSAKGGLTPGPPAEGESSAGPPATLDPLAQSDPLKKKPSALPPVRRWVNRDWNIFIECRADGVVLYPGGLPIAAAKLSGSGKIGDHPLPTAVQQLIARRQAVMGQAAGNERVGPPHIHFLVRPDGLRSYYQAYPELQGLQLQMTRENLDPDDDVTRHVVAR